MGEQGFRVVAEGAVGQRMQGLPECRAGGIGPGVEGLEQGAGVFLEAAVLLARFRGLADGALFAFGEVALEEFAFDLHLQLHIQPAFLFEQGVQAGWMCNCR
ncbi:hypothetical protein PAERUG_E16_London_17_VIM_2_04_14_00837 [Pseudomonas aeruginosa]|nr:hypothetical protein PAERUG_E16_London_17_VIM_2_04_14_00837 [Pseudomonas aeruginosa]